MNHTYLIILLFTATTFCSENQPTTSWWQQLVERIDALRTSVVQQCPASYQEQVKNWFWPTTAALSGTALAAYLACKYWPSKETQQESDTSESQAVTNNTPLQAASSVPVDQQSTSSNAGASSSSYAASSMSVDEPSEHQDQPELRVIEASSLQAASSAPVVILAYTKANDTEVASFIQTLFSKITTEDTSRFDTWFNNQIQLLETPYKLKPFVTRITTEKDGKKTVRIYLDYPASNTISSGFTYRTKYTNKTSTTLGNSENKPYVLRSVQLDDENSIEKKQFVVIHRTQNNDTIIYRLAPYTPVWEKK